MNTKLELTISQVWAINQNSTVLRSYTGFNIELANKVNAFSVALIGTIKQINDTDEIFTEKKKGIIKMSDGEDKIKAIDQLDVDILKEGKKKFNVNFTLLKKSEFNREDGKPIEISGAKEVEQQNGSIKKFDYRDAFFGLMNEGLIIE